MAITEGRPPENLHAVWGGLPSVIAPSFLLLFATFLVRITMRGGLIVGYQAHNLEIPVQFRTPRQRLVL